MDSNEQQSSKTDIAEKVSDEALEELAYLDNSTVMPEELTPNKPAKPEKEKKHKHKYTPKYAWIVALGGALSQVVIIMANQAFQFNVAYMAEDFGMAATSLAIASSLYGLTYAGCGALWGNINDSIGFRKSMTIAALGVGIWLITFGVFVNDVLSASILLGLTGAFASGLSIAVIPKLISTWFAPNSRGKGISVGLCGGYITATAMGILAPALILNFGWRGCFIGLGLICLCASPVLLLLLRDNPQKVGTEPFGMNRMSEDYRKSVKETEAKTQEDKALKRARIRRVLSMPITWKFGIIYILWQFMMTAENTYITLMLVENGYTLIIAGLVSSVYEIMSMVGGIAFPILSDRIPRKYVLTGVSIIAGIVYMALYWVVGLHDQTILFMSMAVVGLFCSVLSLLQTTVAECFPTDLRGTGPGMVGTISLVGRFGGPLVAGWFIVNVGGGSSTIYTVFAGACLILVGLLSILWLPRTGGKVGDPMAEGKQLKQK